MLPNRWPLLLLLLPLLLPAQERSDFQQILQRLDQLERQNRNLADEVHALRAEIAGARPLNPLGETSAAVARMARPSLVLLITRCTATIIRSPAASRIMLSSPFPEDPRTIGLCTHLLFVAKNMERTGDHATNIAETVYYMVTGGHLTMDRPKSDVTSTTNVKFERPE